MQKQAALMQLQMMSQGAADDHEYCTQRMMFGAEGFLWAAQTWSPGGVSLH